MEATIRLNKPQYEFVSLNQQFSAFVAGYGSGKTYIGCTKLGLHFCDFPGIDAGYFAPTYPHIRDIFYPTAEECLESMGFSIEVKQSDKEVHVFNGVKRVGIIRCRSMDRPESIVGFKIGCAVVDEIDVLPQVKAQTAWRKIIARMRYKVDGLKNSVAVTTTPEGFKFVYNQFVKAVRENPQLASLYGIVQASTYDNAANLPAGYIESMRQTYPAQLIEAYINGQFVNLTTGTIYVAYDRKANDSKEVVKESEPVHVGMDFNVGKMAAVIHVLRDGKPHAVAEITGAYDTPDMIRRLKESLWKYEDGRFIPTRQITVYPDASGDSRKSVNASKTDISLLREAGFRVDAPAMNPPVKDRINAMNAMFCNAEGERRYFVNSSACPAYSEALEQQPWAENGEPDKSTGHDHLNDSGGYYIIRKFPIVKRQATGFHPFG